MPWPLRSPPESVRIWLPDQDGGDVHMADLGWQVVSTVSDLDLLPAALAAESRMEREIALPYPLVLDAIDALEARGVVILGWEALATWPDGGFGAYPGGGIMHFTVDESLRASVDAVPAAAAAAAVRATVIDEATTRRGTPRMPGVELIFCVTCAKADEPGQKR